MQHEFLLGFIKQAIESGYSDDQIQSLWKLSMEHGEFRQMVDSLKKEGSDNMNIIELEVLSDVKRRAEKRAYINKLKNTISSICE